MSDIAAIRQLLLAQDNAGTSDPVFVVQRRVRDTGYDPDYIDDACWIDIDGTVLTKDTEPDTGRTALRSRAVVYRDAARIAREAGRPMNATLNTYAASHAAQLAEGPAGYAAAALLFCAQRGLCTVDHIELVAALIAVRKARLD